MAHRGLIFVALVACTPAPRPTATPAPASTTSATPATWGRFHSKRFLASVALPEGKTWKIDDHSRDDLVATQGSTSSRLSLVILHEEGLMNRERCAERAAARGDVPPHLATVEDHVTPGPDAYDSRTWIAVETENGSITGHAFLFGAFLRTCLLVHFTTQAHEEALVSSRLAVAGARILPSVTVDAARITGDAALPREHP